MSIASEISRLQQAKADIKTAIEAKGVIVASDATLDEYATLIESISGGDDEEFKALISRTIENLTIPDGVTTIDSYAFYHYSNLKSVIIPNSVTTIGASAFYDCTGLTSVTIGNGVTSSGNYAFRGCTGLTSVTLPNSMTRFGSGVFYGCTGLVSVVLSSGLSKLASDMFYGCTSLKSVTIPSSITTFQSLSNIFRGCTSLEYVDICNIAHLGTYTFYSCDKLSTIVCRSTNPPTASGVFGNNASTYTGRLVSGTKKLYVPYGCSANYTGATSTQWVTILLDSSKCNFTIAELDQNGNIPV